MSSYRQAKTPRLRWLCCNIVAANIQPPPSPAPPMYSYRQVKTPRLRWLCCNIVAANIQPPPSPAPMSFYRQEAVIAVGVDFMSIRSPIRANSRQEAAPPQNRDKLAFHCTNGL
ncbi:MAG: hypothetical protein IKI26_07745 [Prevotella sp.]|nr:hypothetical protein [Prevotella sp.]